MLSIKIIKNFTFLISFSGFILVNSQQNIQYSDYLLNQFAFNPATSGSKNCIEINLVNRMQWVGFEGAPSNIAIGFSGIVKKNKHGLNFKHGLGIVIENTSYGVFNRLRFKLSYAYHFPVFHDMLMSTGMFIGIDQLSFKRRLVDIYHLDDPFLPNTKKTSTFPILSPGMFLQSKVWFTGISIEQITRPTIKTFESDARWELQANWLMGLNLKYENLRIVPSAMLKIINNSPFVIDIGMEVRTKKRLNFGLSYRNNDALIAHTSYSFLNYFTLGYSFDFTTSQISTASSNTHELSLHINTCGYKEKSRVACPTFDY